MNSIRLVFDDAHDLDNKTYVPFAQTGAIDNLRIHFARSKTVEKRKSTNETMCQPQVAHISP